MTYTVEVPVREKVDPADLNEVDADTAPLSDGASVLPTNEDHLLLADAEEEDEDD